MGRSRLPRRLRGFGGANEERCLIVPSHGGEFVEGKVAMQLIGIDCATKPKNIGIALAELAMPMRVCEVRAGVTDPWERVADWLLQTPGRGRVDRVGCATWMAAPSRRSAQRPFSGREGGREMTRTRCFAEPRIAYIHV